MILRPWHMVLENSNMTCFVSHSGQTGSGKTFTMIGMELQTS